MVEVPVLSRTIGRGERIAAGDLDWIHLAPGRLPKASLTEASLIIGTEAKRRLRPGKVITNRDVGPPRLVRRGQSVRVIYADGDLRLTTLGTARDDGAFGEPIRVFNPESNLQIQGVATGPDEVSVGSSVMPGAG
jgi:flagella basal body P-ring formation protein FlgA